MAVGAERKRGAEQQDALQLAAQLGARSQGGGGGGASSRSGAGGGEGATDKDKKLKNLRKVSKRERGREGGRESLWYTCDISKLILIMPIIMAVNTETEADRTTQAATSRG